MDDVDGEHDFMKISMPSTPSILIVSQLFIIIEDLWKVQLSVLVHHESHDSGRYNA